jgi:hypothetical protein
LSPVQGFVDLGWFTQTTRPLGFEVTAGSLDHWIGAVRHPNCATKAKLELHMVFGIINPDPLPISRTSRCQFTLFASAFAFAQTRSIVWEGGFGQFLVKAIERKPSVSRVVS